MYERILVPTDGSKGAERGVEHALAIAERDGATVHALHVVDERIYGATPALSSDELFIEKLGAAGDRALDEVVAAAEGRGVTVERELVRGLPHERILRYADEHDVDLVVMGRHGSSDHPRPHVGSTTERVVRMAEMPVMPV